MENNVIFLESCLSQTCYKSCFCQGLFLQGSSLLMERPSMMLCLLLTAKGWVFSYSLFIVDLELFCAHETED